MAKTIKRITIEGFKSIRKLEDFELRPLNILIGANGAGKSNFVGFFRLLREMVEQRLQLAVAREGGADACLFLGPKETRSVVGKLSFRQNGYEFELVPTTDNRLVFAQEVAVWNQRPERRSRPFGTGHVEARLKDYKDDPGYQAKVGIPHSVEEHPVARPCSDGCRYISPCPRAIRQKGWQFHPWPGEARDRESTPAGQKRLLHHHAGLLRAGEGFSRNAGSGGAVAAESGAAH